VQIELYADGTTGGDAVRQKMTRIHSLSTTTTGEYLYGVMLRASRPARDHTARAMPRFGGISVPLEEERIPWQH
jgi:hypothetical protein